MSIAASGNKRMPGMDYAFDAIIGRRAEQQDSVRCMRLVVSGRDAVLLIVADGMGGAAGGQIASSTAVAAFEAHFKSDDGPDLVARLLGALDAANAAIGAQVQRDRSLRGMGCTLIGAVVQGRDVTWVSVGDSLMLAVSGEKLVRLNDDHSLAAVLDKAAKRGEITRQEAEQSHQRSMLRSALTGDEIAMIDRGATRLRPGTRLIVATDGILTLPFRTIARLAAQARSAAGLVEETLAAVRANMPDDQDNLTVAALVVDGRNGSARPGAPIWAKLVLVLGLIGIVGAAVAYGVINKSAAPIAAPSRAMMQSPPDAAPQNRDASSEKSNAGTPHKKTAVKFNEIGEPAADGSQPANPAKQHGAPQPSLGPGRGAAPKAQAGPAKNNPYGDPPVANPAAASAHPDSHRDTAPEAIARP